MNRQKKFIILSVLILVAALLAFHAVSVFGGDFIDHGGDWGGGGGDYSGGSDYNDYSSGSWDSSGGGDGISGPSAIVIIILVIVFVVFSAIRKNKFGNASPTNTYSTTPLQMSDTSSVNIQSINNLKQTDPTFSEAAMLSKVENLFTTMQLAWCNQDYEPVRPFLSNALYEQQAKQIADKITRDEKNVSSNIAVLQSKLESFSTDGHTEFLNIWLRVKLKDYIVKKSNPSQIITGSPDRTYYLDFRWQMTRSAGGKTVAETDAVKTGECPSCGANININQSGKCEYCGTVISTTEYDWVLSKIDGLQQRSR